MYRSAKCHRGQRPVRIRSAREQPGGFFLRNDDGPTAEYLRAADVIDVRVAVNDVRDRIGRHFSDGLRNVRRVGRRRIDHHDAFVVHEQHRLIGVVGQHVEPAPEILQAIPFGRIDGRPPRRRRHIDVLAGPFPDRRDLGHLRVRLSGRPLNATLFA